MVLAVNERKIKVDQAETAALHPSLSLSIRDLLLKEIIDKAMGDSPRVKDLASQIKHRMEIIKIEKYETFINVAGVDAGSQILPLASRKFAVIGALVYYCPTGFKFFLEPESLSSPYNHNGEGFTGSVNLRREAKLYETAYKFIEARPDTELILIDGPLAFSNWWRNAGEEKDRQRLINAVNRLLKKCRNTSIVIAGIVKRPSARYLINYLGLQNETDLSDSFIMHQALSPGERTDIFSPRCGLRMATGSSSIMDAIETPIYAFYCRLTNEWNIPPIRIDIPAYCLGLLDDIASYCYSTSLWEGIPLPIVKADEEVKVSRRFIGDVYTEILSRVGRQNGEISQLAPYWGESDWMGL
jgi:hypothetical protein